MIRTLFLAAPLLAGLALAGDFLTLMRKADSRGETGEKIEYYTRAIKAWTPRDGQALLANCHFRRGEALFDRRQVQAAVPDLDKALRLDPRNAQAYFMRGRAHLQAGRHQKAAADLEEYAALAPQDIEGLLAWGLACRLAGQREASLAAYRRAALLEPVDFRPALGAGMTYMTMRQWRAAKDSFDEADALARHRDPEVLVERAAAKTAMGDRASALKDLDAAVPLHEARLILMERGAAPKQDIEAQREKTVRARARAKKAHAR